MITGAHALAVELDGQRATGLRYARGGREQLATASREVILCGGAIGSPHILQLSGIGPREHLEAAGIKVRRLPIGARFRDLFTIGWFAHEDTLKNNPELLAGFGRALSKGSIVCEVNVEWCVKTFWKYYPNLKPRDGNDDDNVKRQGRMIKAGLISQMDFPPGPRRFGEYPADSWKNFIKILYEGGEIPNDSIDPNVFYTNELVDRMNQFDQAAIARQARDLK